jgi:hypothetical protein
MDEVDALVERLGVDGRNRDIVAAAELAVAAHREGASRVLASNRNRPPIGRREG